MVAPRFSSKAALFSWAIFSRLAVEGEVVPPLPVPDYMRQPARGTRIYHSLRFQWLPAEVEFSGDAGTTDVRFTSYINNLHPYKHKDLYHTIEKVISLAIPLWNDVHVRHFDKRRTRITAFKPVYVPALPDWAKVSRWPTESVFRSPADDGYPEYLEKVKQYLALPEPETTTGNDGESVAYSGPPEQHPQFLALQRTLDQLSSGDAIYRQWDGWFQSPHSNAIHEKWERIRKAHHPEPRSAKTFQDWEKRRSDLLYQDPAKIRLQDSFRSKGLQIIVKLASIELTPD